MQRIENLMKAKAIELLENGTVNRVLGWTKGDLYYDNTPAVFGSKEEIENNFVTMVSAEQTSLSTL